jgi:hypothetical protein
VCVRVLRRVYPLRGIHAVVHSQVRVRVSKQTNKQTNLFGFGAVDFDERGVRLLLERRPAAAAPVSPEPLPIAIGAERTSEHTRCATALQIVGEETGREGWVTTHIEEAPTRIYVCTLGTTRAGPGHICSHRYAHVNIHTYINVRVFAAPLGLALVVVLQSLRRHDDELRRGLLVRVPVAAHTASHVR